VKGQKISTTARCIFTAIYWNYFSNLPHTLLQIRPLNDRTNWQKTQKKSFRQSQNIIRKSFAIFFRTQNARVNVGKNDTLCG